MARISLEHVSKRYGDVTAVRDLTLEVADGEFMVLLGPSGCGKTTVLRTCAGLVPVVQGEATVAGVDLVTDLEENLPRVNIDGNIVKAADHQLGDVFRGPQEGTGYQVKVRIPGLHPASSLLAGSNSARSVVLASKSCSCCSLTS